MGAWSHESFGNDDACDWAAQLEEYEDLSLVEATLDKVLALGDEDDLEAPEASEAIAAAEVVARLQGNAGARDADTEDVDAWVERIKLLPSPGLAAKARRALDRVLSFPGMPLTSAGPSRRRHAAAAPPAWSPSGRPSGW